MVVWIKRGVVYLLGLFTVALGVSISKMSDLGVSPVNSIPNVISEILQTDMGLCTTCVFIGFIFVQMLILRKDFKMIYFLQIICSVIFGFFVSITNRLTSELLPGCGSYGMKIVYVLISIFFVALGILLYLEADILSLPGEGVMQAVSKKTGIQVSTAKLIFDWTVVAIAAVLSLIFMKGLVGVREGTVLAAVGVGVCLKVLNRFFKRPLQQFLEIAV